MSTREEFSLLDNKSQLTKFLESLLQPVTQVAAARDPVTSKTEPACLPYQLESLPDGLYPVFNKIVTKNIDGCMYLGLMG